MSRLLTRLPNRARLLPMVPRRAMATELGTSKSPQNGQKGFVSVGSQAQGDSPSNQGPTEAGQKLQKESKGKPDGMKGDSEEARAAGGDQKAGTSGSQK
ncbi:hypothetical protein NEUTE1DRAFT_136559 [Neurospora tetrasperma FGSC 2508]|uniref:Uncharacterized protein n=1 Tax=Neurospora tetrasperma (strain FGSC 2508 / ATCC MYA-4615 / P0657) TaxID=510951 RepID=F8MGS7_NEUT8|nr:uncharacterized protein NEUTE1DRAFT_136559 [Neurospora tetrasperma FGSC 2508]EGO59496.1 hypothetical protein NEUTE1DRAFT_136559 [Neurospora tetrasperma FGSC 2508]EGZ73622.1 hypothetical protein NEUTE2DRAFT_62029 [Neurospora tetrasperma FGSC 2509]